jgi:hypothetical protein
MKYNEVCEISADGYAWHGPETTEQFEAVLAALDSGEFWNYQDKHEKGKTSKFSFQYDLSAGVRKFGTKTEGRILHSYEYKGRQFEEFINLSMVDIRPVGADWFSKGVKSA